MGPLTGFRIVEFAGIGPGPMAAMLFADLGASIIRLDRLTPSGLGIDKPARFDLIARSRPSVAVHLKHPDGLALAADLIGEADALIEGFRPGTMERLGLGPEAALARNPRLVYGRITGWGQSGPLAQAAGHDLNYLALTGALAAIGRAGSKPTPPLNLVADFGGGALYLAFGMACAMVEAQRSGKGQVVDAAMTEGAASLMTGFYGLHAAGLHTLERGTNLLDSGSAIYETYECADGRFVSIAPIELKFRKVLFELLGLPQTNDDGAELRGKLERLFKTRTRDEWCSLLEGTDACFAPVLTMAEAPHHPHIRLDRRVPVVMVALLARDVQPPVDIAYLEHLILQSHLLGVPRACRHTNFALRRLLADDRGLVRGRQLSASPVSRSPMESNSKRPTRAQIRAPPSNLRLYQHHRPIAEMPVRLASVHF